MKACPTCRKNYTNDIVYCPQDGAALRAGEGLAPGSVIRKKYEILDEIGRGGMGVVYRARHLIWNEQKALKVLAAERHGEQQGLKGLMAEALVMRQLQHPHIVRIEDADYTEDDQPFLVMEYVVGESLRERVQRAGPLDPEPALRIAAEACSALAAAHQKGIVHRDIKPQNLLLAKEAGGGETVKVIDFGIAKVREDAGLGLTGVMGSTTGLFVCTPAYASPEQAQGMRGGDLDGRTDLYSLGVVLYEMLTGRLPFSGATPEALLWQRLQARPIPLEELRPNLPRDVVRVVMKALEQQRENRYGSAEEMERAIRAVLAAREAERARQERETVAMPPPAPSRPAHKRSATTVPRAPQPTRGTRAKWVFAAMLVATGITVAIWRLWPGTTGPAPAAPAVSTQPAPRPVEKAPQAVAQPNPAPIAFDVAATLSHARQKRAAGLYDDAIKLYQSVLAHDSSNQEARRGLHEAQSARAAESEVFR